MTDLEKDKILLLAHSVGKMARELQSIKRLLKEIADTPQTETQTETQNSNLTFEKDECAKEYEELGLKELKELINADRKTEPQTTDYCDVCNHKGCDNCIADGSNPYCVPSQFEPKDEPTGYNLSPVEDETQTEVPRCSVNGTPYDECGFCEYFNCDTCRCEADEPQTETKTETKNSNLTFEKRTMRDCYNCKKYETEGECIECHYEPKDESQTERSE